MNKLILAGNISSEIKVSNTSNNFTIVTFNLAVRQDKEKTNFIMLKALGKTAELISTYCKIGDSILVEASIINNNYKDKQGTMHYQNEIMINRVEFLKKADKKAENVVKKETKEKPSEDVYSQMSYEIRDEELPF